jgi:hypothetical protein
MCCVRVELFRNEVSRWSPADKKYVSISPADKNDAEIPRAQSICPRVCHGTKKTKTALRRPPPQNNRWRPITDHSLKSYLLIFFFFFVCLFFFFIIIFLFSLCLSLSLSLSVSLSDLVSVSTSLQLSCVGLCPFFVFVFSGQVCVYVTTTQLLLALFFSYYFSRCLFSLQHFY